MLRSILALALLAPWAFARSDAPTPREAAVESYLGQADVGTFDSHRFVHAPAGGGIVGWLSVRAYYWLPSLDGDMRSGGERLDFEDDLGIDESEGGVMPQVVLTFGPFSLKADAFFLEFEGSTTTTRTFTFGGVPFTISEDVDSSLRIDNYRLLSMFRLIHGKSVNLALIGGVSVFDFDGRVTGSVSGTASESGTVPIPVGGVLLQVEAGRFLFEVDVVGLTIEYGDIEATVLDAQVVVGVTVFKVVAVRAGYRYMLVDAVVDAFSIDATLDGFFAGVSVQF